MSDFYLQLKDYFFIHQFVEPNPLFDIEKNADFVNNVSSFIRKDENTNTYNLQVDIDLNEQESKNVSYRYKFKIFGIFSITDKTKDQRIQFQIARDQGTSLLIGAIRERLSLLTSSGPYTNYVLDFVPLDKISYFVPALNEEVKETKSSETIGKRHSPNRQTKSKK